MDPQTEPELILPPGRLVAMIVTVLTGAFLVAVICTHLLLVNSRAPRVTDAVPSGELAEGNAALRQYMDAGTIGMY